MRYIIYGAGAIGGVVGGRLFAAGKDTVLICRGRHLEAIRERGLLLRDPTGDRSLRVPAAGSPAELQFSDQDVVILTMKAQDTSAALDALEMAGGRDVAIVCCQNGVANERMAARRFDRVYAMLVALPATFMEPGVVLGWSTPVAGVLDVGRFPDGTDALCDQLGADLGDAGFICRPDPVVMRLKYAKLLTNLGNGFDAISTLSRADAPFRTYITIPCAVSHDRAAALAAVKAHVAVALLKPQWPVSEVSREAGAAVRAVYDAYEHMSPSANAKFAQAVPDAAVTEFALAGTPAECIARSEELFAGGVDEITVRPYGVNGESRLAAMEAFARDVMQPLRR